MHDKTLVIVLAGSAGSGLSPLTDERAKAAVPFGGKYRVIDFVLTNCLHSGLRRVLVLTQYKSHSLQKHLRDGWSIFNPELGEYITPVPPQMRSGDGWYAGSVDAIRQNRYLLERSGAEWVLILCGEHVYRMDYAPLLRFHQEHGAVASVACVEPDMETGAERSVLCVDGQHMVTQYHVRSAAEQASPCAGERVLTPMGVYVFSTSELLKCLLPEGRGSLTPEHDLERDLLPELVDGQALRAYEFGGLEGRVSVDKYWRHLPTIDAYYAANMDLLRPLPSINLYQDDWPIRSYSGQHPPARTVPGNSGTEGLCINSIVANGVVIAGGSVQHSILFPRVFLDDESLVEDALLFDGVRVGEGARIKHCIIDKDVRVPRGEHIGYDANLDRQRFAVSQDGVVVVPRGYRF